PAFPCGAIEFRGFGDGIHDEDAAGGAGEFAGDEAAEFGRVVEAGVDGEGRVGAAEVEGGEVIGLVAGDGDAERFQEFAGGGDVEDGLDAAGDDGDGEAGERDEVGGDIEVGVVAAVHAAEAAGGEETDAGLGGELHGGADGGGAVPAAGQGGAEVGGIE